MLVHLIDKLYLYTMKTSNTELNDQVVISRGEYNELLSIKSDCEYLRFQLSELKRMLYGVRSERFRSEKTDDGQLDLFAGTRDSLRDIQPKAEANKETITYEREKTREKPVRSRLPEHLRREEEVIEPDLIPDGAVKIGESVTELLEYKPADVYVRVIIRPKYVVPGTEGEGCVTVAPMPSLPIVKGNAGAGILSHICASKFIDHLPFYRQAEIFKRQKIPVAESTLKGWYAAVCRLLEPLHDTLIHEIMKRDYLQVDESPIPVLTSDKPGATHKGYMWVFHAPVEGMACFRYGKSRSGDVAAGFLDGYRGALQTDAYAGYDQYKDAEHITLLACMAHSRRKFEHAKENSPSRSRQALDLFAKLYRVEKRAREEKMPFEERHRLREQQSIPVMEELKRWLEDQRGQVLPKSPIGIAVAYTLKIWDRLERTMTDGKFEIDNNEIENKIRKLALGRRNYLFCGSHEGAERNAMMYSFFACCREAGVNPTRWMTDVFNRIPDHHANKLEELLPHNWKENILG